MSIADKLVTIAENQERVYESGKSAIINELKEKQNGVASGEVVKITDISPIEHTLEVTLSDANATLSVYGKNLFNNDTSLMKSVSYKAPSGGTGSRFGYIIPLPCGTYTIRAYREGTFSEYVYMAIVVDNVDDPDIDYNMVQSGLQVVVGSTFKTVTCEIKSGQMLFLYNGSSTSTLAASKTMFSKFDIQLEIGGSATEFERYVEPTIYTPNSDGTVDNVKSVFPTTLLTTNTEGVLINCEYIKDLNAVIGELTNAIISLGGDV